MKKLFTLILIMLLALSMTGTAFAEDSSREYLFRLSVDGSDTKKAEPGDIITLVFSLERCDSDESADIYAMQNEIRYDSSFFELIEGSELLADGIQMRDLGLRDDNRELYMNFLSLSGGSKWKANTTVGTVQLRVIGQTGSSVISNEDYAVSTADGLDRFKASAQNVNVIVTGDCSVSFVSNGGGDVESIIVPWGEKLSAPEVSREGYSLEGWYRDIDLTVPWNFDADRVENNITLYAKWTEGTAESEQSGGFMWLWILLLLLAAAVAAYIFCKKKQKK